MSTALPFPSIIFLQQSDQTAGMTHCIGALRRGKTTQMPRYGLWTLQHDSDRTEMFKGAFTPGLIGDAVSTLFEFVWTFEHKQSHSDAEQNS